MIINPTVVFAEIPDTCREVFEGRRATIAVPNGPGGGYDTYAREIAPFLADVTGLNVRVANIEAGGGRVAYELTLSASEADLVLLLTNINDLAVVKSEDGKKLILEDSFREF